MDIHMPRILGSCCHVVCDYATETQHDVYAYASDLHIALASREQTCILLAAVISVALLHAWCRYTLAAIITCVCV